MEKKLIVEVNCEVDLGGDIDLTIDEDFEYLLPEIEEDKYLLEVAEPEEFLLDIISTDLPDYSLETDKIIVNQIDPGDTPFARGKEF